MNVDRVREYLLGLPHVVESEQWGGLVFWVGDKVIGGKMFVMVALDGDPRHSLMSYHAGPERFHELQEIDGISPAPYLARAFWVGVARWDVHRTAEWERELSAAHALTFAKLPPKVLKVLALSKAEQKRVIAEKRRALKAKATAP